jgi:hypothetical protein
MNDWRCWNFNRASSHVQQLIVPCLPVQSYAHPVALPGNVMANLHTSPHTDQLADSLTMCKCEPWTAPH